MRIAEHAERVALRNRIASGHQLGNLLLRFLRLQIHHRIEDASGDSFHDVGVVFGEVGPREPHVRDQLVGGRGGDEHVIALHLLEVVNVGSPADAPGEPLVRVERRSRLKRILGELELDFRGLDAGVDQGVQDEEMRRRVLREHDRLAAQVRHRLDRVAHDNAVAAVRPVDLLIHTRHDARVLAQPFEEQGNHVERRPADVQIACGVGVSHGDGIINQHEFDLEVLAVRRLPELSRFESVVRENDWAPAGPDVDPEANRAIRHRLVAGDALHFRQPSGRDVVVFLDRRDAGAVGRLGTGLHFLQFVGRELTRLRLRSNRSVTPQRQAHQAEHHEEDGNIKRRSGLSIGHV